VRTKLGPAHLLRWRVQKPTHLLFMVSVDCILFEFNLDLQETSKMAIQVPQDKTISLGIRYLDQNGQPMLSPVNHDQPPSWSNSDAIGSLAVAPDGLTAVFTPSAPGNTNVRLTVTSGTRQYNAELGIEVTPSQPVNQIFSSVEISAVVQDPQPAPTPPAPPQG
jgi:hypothetical protein